jgi:hypothetical protein
MFNGDNYTTKHMYAWGDQYVTKPFWCRFIFHRNEAGNKAEEAVSVASFISSSLWYVNGIQLAKFRT